ncbi:Protease 4 [Caulifigura coniformis]|uniref:Protease 4 n=1 Tax=Caulifigura coniformis TaxID=2527983 RepID=A0A517SFG6_9PLAN|nr:signal peptide peptidase SppA [Caulifigura coniformis]QDT54869.1 Protease 4 [Caulifigura coniformis]
MLRLRHSLFWMLSAAVLALPQLAPPAAIAADTKSTSEVIPVFTLKSVVETPTPEDPIFGAIGQESLVELIRRMDKAAKDENVKAVVLLLDSVQLGYGQIEEVRQGIQRLKDAKKPVYAHADSLTTGTYAVLCGATRLSASPTSDLFLTGLYSEQMYLKGLFDKLKIQPDFLTCGAYKSAAEMFMRTGPSAEAKSMYDWLYDGMYASVIDLIAKGRGVDAAKAKEWIDQGLFSAESARKAGLIDAVEFRQDFQAYVKSQTSEVAKLDAKYGKPKGLDLDLNNPFAAMQLWAQILAGPQVKRSNKDAVAVVYVDGPIMLGKAEASPFGGSAGAFSEPIRKALDEASRDDKVKAVVLRVDSPGGSAIASEIILNATKRVKEKKPLVVSMGNVAGSGGYYVACGSDTIFADSATITGSIGVVAGKLATTDMWDQLGISFSANARGKKAGILSSGSKFSDEERKELQGWMDEVYGVFKGHVVKIRGERLKKPIDDLAGGRVFTGQQALELGLVDKIGTLTDAIAFAASAAKVTDYELRTMPKPTNFLEGLLGEVSGQKKDDQYLMTPAAFFRGNSGSSLPDTLLPLLNSLDPQRAKLVLQAFTQLHILHSEKVSLTMPIFGVSN